MTRARKLTRRLFISSLNILSFGRVLLMMLFPKPIRWPFCAPDCSNGPAYLLPARVQRIFGAPHSRRDVIDSPTSSGERSGSASRDAYAARIDFHITPPPPPPSLPPPPPPLPSPPSPPPPPPPPPQFRPQLSNLRHTISTLENTETVSF